MDNSFDLIVIGAGVAGLAAARQALRQGLGVGLAEQQIFGGLVINVNALDGAIQGSGAEYASNLMGEVVDLGGRSIDTAVARIDAPGEGFVLHAGEEYRSRAIVVASGAVRRKLGIPGESELEHRGVSHCADCDGPMFSGQDVVVVGGGDSALQSALALAGWCRTVHLIHRRAEFRGKPHLVAAVAGSANIRVHMNSEVIELAGADRLEAARVNGELLPCAGFFAYVGLEPATRFLPAAVERDAGGAVLTSGEFETSMPGVFAAGAARAGYGGTIEEALAEGEAAARAAAARVQAQVAH